MFVILHPTAIYGKIMSVKKKEEEEAVRLIVMLHGLC